MSGWCGAGADTAAGPTQLQGPGPAVSLSGAGLGTETTAGALAALLAKLATTFTFSWVVDEARWEAPTVFFLSLFSAAAII